ncbi:uncharacterized protein LOC135498027 [Lineus longissimus]|uniref:uncharacterized protein LOC135498027 n=1 Tax=Lineus longissimus TaxID=88925 RepID=UPI00315D414C
MESTSFAVFSCALLLSYAGVDSHWNGRHNHHLDHHHHDHHHHQRRSNSYHYHKACPLEEADELPAELQNRTLPSGYPHYLREVMLSHCQGFCSRMFRCEAIIFLMNPNSDEGKGKCISLFRDISSRAKFEGKLKLKSEHEEDAVYMLKKCPKQKRRHYQPRMQTNFQPPSSNYQYPTSSEAYPGYPRGMRSDAYPRSSEVYPGYSRGIRSDAYPRSSEIYPGYSRGMRSDAYPRSSEVYPGYSRGMRSDAYPRSSEVYPGYSRGMRSDTYPRSSEVYPGYSRGMRSDAYPRSSEVYPGYSRGMGSEVYPRSSGVYPGYSRGMGSYNSPRSSEAYSAAYGTSTASSSTIAPTPTWTWKEGTSRNENEHHGDSSAYIQASAGPTSEPMSSFTTPTRPYVSAATTKSSTQHPQPTKWPARQTPKNAQTPKPVSLRPRIKSTRPGSSCRYYKTNVTEARQVYFTDVMRKAPHGRILPFRRCMAECDKRSQCDYFSIYGPRKICCLVENKSKKPVIYLKHCKKKGKKVRCTFPVTARERIWDSYHQVANSKVIPLKGTAEQTLRECMKRCEQASNLCSAFVYRESIKHAAHCFLLRVTPLFGRSCNVLQGEKCDLKRIKRPFTQYRYSITTNVKNRNAPMKLCNSQCNSNPYCVMVTYIPKKKAGRRHWRPPYCLIWVANSAMKKQCTGGNCKLVKMEAFVTKIPVLYFASLHTFKRNSMDTCKAECQKNIRQCLGFEVIAEYRAGCRIFYEMNYQRKVCTAGTCKMIPVKKGEHFKVPGISYSAVLGPENCTKKCEIEESCHSVGMVESTKHCRLFGINFAQPTTYYKQCDANKKCTMKIAQENTFIASYWRVQKNLMIARRVRGTSSAVCQAACSRVEECTAVFDAWSADLEFRNCYMLKEKAYHYKKVCRNGRCKSIRVLAILPANSTDFHVVSKEYGPSHRSCSDNCQWNDDCHILDIYPNHAAKLTKGGTKHHAKNRGSHNPYEQYNSKHGKFVCVVIRHQRMPTTRKRTVNPWKLIDFDPTPYVEIKRFTKRCKGKMCKMVYTEAIKNRPRCEFIPFTGLLKKARSRSLSKCFRKCVSDPDCAFTFVKTSFSRNKKLIGPKCFFGADPTMYAKECKKRTS